MSRKILLFILFVSGFCAPRCGATVYHSNGSVANVQTLHNSASDGDTITLPTGTFNWTSRLTITKGITLQGQTTITDAGTATPSVTDATIIKDYTSRTDTQHGIMDITVGAGNSVRLTRITFQPGSSTQFAANNGAFHFISHGASPSTVRIDHCHFASLYQGKLIWINGWIYGVADHNLFEVISNCFPFSLWHDSWGGSTQLQGNGSWADYPWYGTEKFWFIETNTVKRINATAANSLVDSEFGGRCVIRHNYLQNTMPNGHGTEGLLYRGQRTQECYDNTFNATVEWNAGGQRSGGSLFHDNTFLGRLPDDVLCSTLSNLRETPHYNGAQQVWGYSDGTSPWDQNDTEGNGTYVEGHPPHLFASGSATTGTTNLRFRATFTDSTKNWTTNRWVGYSIKATNPNSTAYNLGSFIISNTANRITYYYYSDPGIQPHMIFNPGDTYEIHRVLVAMDQCGRGKGDQVTGTLPINRTAGRPLWTHQALEPCYSWNNVHTPTNRVLGFGPGLVGQPTTKLGVDYFNFGGGFPADTTPPAVSSTYTAALNGVDYVGPFVYPHPLVSSASVPTDFNGDGKPDYLLYNPTTQQTAIWYLNNEVLIGHAFGPTPPYGWSLVGVADFNGDGKPDYLLYNPTTQQTAIWYLNNNVLVGQSSGPTLWPGWNVAAVADFNQDGHPDYLLFAPSTGQTAIWYLNNNVLVGHSFGPTLWPGWNVAAVADFNQDGHPDYLLFAPSTRQTAIWYLNDNVLVGHSFGPTAWAGWSLVAP